MSGQVRSSRSPKVYFIRCCEFVKIGTSTDVPNRLLHLQTSSPFALILIATVNGGTIEEGVWHGRFADARTQGEWFLLTDQQITAAIEEHREADAEAYRLNTILRHKNAIRMQLSRMEAKSNTPLPTPKTLDELHALIKAEAARPAPRSSVLDCLAQHMVLLDDTDVTAKKLVKFLQIAAKGRAKRSKPASKKPRKKFARETGRGNWAALNTTLARHNDSLEDAQREMRERMGA